MTTLAVLLLRAGGREDVGVRLVDRHETASWWSWSTITERARLVASRLRAQGVAPGDRVALVLPTSIEFLDAFWGVVLAGAVPVPLAPPQRLGRIEEHYNHLERAIRAVGVRLVLTDDRLERRLTPRLVESAALAVTTLAALPAPEVDATPVTEQATVISPNDLGLIQFSSGSTLDPKPVALTHAALVSQARALNSLWPEQPGELPPSGVSWLPLYHDMGLIGGLLTAVERPGTITLLAPDVFLARPALWLRTIARYRAAISPAPSFGYAHATRTIRDRDLDGCDLSCWRLALNGSEPIDLAASEEFVARFGAWGLRPEAMTPAYGLAEAALAVSFGPVGRGLLARRYDRAALESGCARPDPGGRPVVSVGPPLTGCTIEIRDRARRRLGEQEVGEVWVTGPSLMAGYFGQPRATARALVDGWLATGDLGFLDQGELFLLGRSKDLIIINGRNYHPSDIEAALVALPGLRPYSAAAVGVRPRETGEELLVVLAEAALGGSAQERLGLPAHIAAAVAGRVGLQPAVIEVLEAGTLARTTSGKLRRAEAARQWLAGEFNPVARGGRQPAQLAALPTAP